MKKSQHFHFVVCNSNKLGSHAFPPYPPKSERNIFPPSPSLPSFSALCFFNPFSLLSQIPPLQTLLRLPSPSSLLPSAPSGSLPLPLRSPPPAARSGDLRTRRIPSDLVIYGRDLMSNRTAQQILQPIRRHAPFASSRPPFGAPDDYHRFTNGGASDARHVSSPADDMVDALVVKTPLKKITAQEENERAGSSEFYGSPGGGYFDAVSSPLLTPVSAKSTRGPYRKRKAPLTPISNAGI